MIRAESGIEIAQMDEAVDQEPGADQEDERNRDLRDHERAAETFSAYACAGIAAAFLERVVEVEMRSLTGRGQTEEKAGDNRNQEGENENFGVDPDHVRMGEILRNKTGQDIETNKGETQTSEATEKRKHYAFEKKLFRQACAIRAKRKPQGDFLLTHSGPG